MSMLEIKHLTKKYDEIVLNDLSVVFPERGLVVIYGDSGCGKSTLLHLIARLDSHYEGQISYNGEDIRNIKQYIKKYVGFVFQNIYLIDDLKVKDNALLSRYFKMIYVSKIHDYFERLKLEKIIMLQTHFLSKGQKQRVAIMRAFIASHPLILCDEPSGSLDQKNSEQVFSLLRELAKEKLVIVVSHDLLLAQKYGHYLYHLHDGQLYLEKSTLCPKTIIQEKKGQKPFFLLLNKLLRNSFKENLIMIQVVFVALFCILLTFSLTQSTKYEIHQQIEQLIPSSTVMCKKKDNQDLSLEDLKLFQKDYIQYRCMEYNDVELLGLSIDQQWNANQMLYISDYIQKCRNDFFQGRIARKDNEIVLSYSTYQHFCKILQKKSLLNQECYLFLQKQDLIVSIPGYIVGITSKKTAIDTIYFKEYSYENICKQLFQVVYGQMCFLQVRQSQDIHLLKKDFPYYRFQLANEGIQTSVDEKIEQLEYILMYFSFLAVISACFLLGEVTYLNVIKRKKMFAICKSMGASSFQVSVLVFSRGLLITLIAYVQSVLLLKQLVQVINKTMIESLKLESKNFFMIDHQLLLVVFLLTMILTIISCYLPVRKAHQIDIIEEIKG